MYKFYIIASIKIRSINAAILFALIYFFLSSHPPISFPSVPLKTSHHIFTSEKEYWFGVGKISQAFLTETRSSHNLSLTQETLCELLPQLQLT